MWHRELGSNSHPIKFMRNDETRTPAVSMLDPIAKRMSLSYLQLEEPFGLKVVETGESVSTVPAVWGWF